MKSSRVQSLVNRIQAWFSQAQQKATDSEETFCDLPAATRQQLVQKLSRLPVPPPYIGAIQAACTEAIAHWQEIPSAKNALVVMAEPVVSMQAVLPDALDQMSADSADSIEIHYPLADYARPADPLAISARFSAALEPLVGKMTASKEDDPTQVDVSRRRQVIVVPALEQCFLRSIHGWQTIEDLQTQIVENPDFFWVIGCSSWAWAFLDRVCHISAYLEQVSPLPALTEEELEDWLSPVVKEAIFVANHQPSSKIQAEAGDRESYWKALTRLSKGHSTIAAHLWLGSVGILAKNLPEEAASRSPEDLALCLQKPVLPALPELTQLDRYLIHALLIHGKMTQGQLTVSLGESAMQVRSRIQILQRDGVVLQEKEYLCLNPGHFPRLRSELSTNNFLIGKVPS